VNPAQRDQIEATVMREPPQADDDGEVTSGVVAVAAVTAPVASAAVVDGTDGSRTFTHQYACDDGSFTVPPWVTQVTVVAVGAAGLADQDNLRNAAPGAWVSGGVGGLGSKVTMTLSVTPGEVLHAGVTSNAMSGRIGGYAGTVDIKAGTALGAGGTGGAASSVSTTEGCSQSSPLVVAGGGGGTGSIMTGGGGGGAGGSGSASAGDNGHGGGDNGAHFGAGGLAGDASPGVAMVYLGDVNYLESSSSSIVEQVGPGPR
jgi:hypothetical protein